MLHFYANEYTNRIQFSQHNVYIFHKHTHANRPAKNCGDFSTDGEYSASITSIVENLGNQDSSRIIILHGCANDVDKFPVVFSRILHTG